MSSLFSTVEMAPRDPILGLNEQFNSDARYHKVNLGVGVYYDENGKLPLLQCVIEAERQMMASPKPRGYLPIDGIAAYNSAVQGLVFGAQSDVVRQGRVATVQALGGTGGLKIGADFLKRLNPNAQVLISDPSWENHRALFTNAGFTVNTYAYYDAQNKGVNFDGMLTSLNDAATGSVIVLHACCHNPTGYDLNPAQWQQVVEVIQSRGLVPFLDMAYQGFGEGITEDGAVIAQFVEAGLDFFVATSFSKSFSLYGERVGALSVVCGDNDQTMRVLSQLKVIIRTNYSNPPTHGAQVVAIILNTPELRAQWEQELGGMRQRIKVMRQELVTRLQGAGLRQDINFITQQKGMFSYSGLNAPQMQRLRNDYGVYGVDSGRICVAALNLNNIDAVVHAIAQVSAGA